MTCSLALAKSGSHHFATAVGSLMKPRLAWLGASQAQTPKSKTFPYHSMSGIPIKTGGWRDKARWGQPCFFSSPRPTASPKEEAIDSPSQARQEDGSNTINSQSDAEPTGDTPVWTPHTPPEVPETLTVSPPTPLQDPSRPLPRHETPYYGVHPASKARCKYRSAP